MSKDKQLDKVKYHLYISGYKSHDDSSHRVQSNY